MQSALSHLSLHKIAVFCAVADHGSITRAAEQLAIAQPVVTAHVRALSDKLGVALTRRTGRRIELTEEGRRVHAWGADLLRRARDLEQALAETREGRRGTATLAASMTFGSYVLPRLLVDSRARFPDADLAVQVVSPRAATQSVRDGGCDMAFTILEPGHDIDGLEVTPMRQEPLILIGAARPDTPQTLSPAQLETLPFVAAQAGTPRRAIEDHALMAAGIGTRRIALELGHAEAIKQAVRAGAGVAFVFLSSVQDDLATGTLAHIDTPGMALSVPIYLVRRRGRPLSPFHAALADHLTQAIRADTPVSAAK